MAFTSKLSRRDALKLGVLGSASLNLVHDDHDTMARFQVGTGGHDPILADAAQDLPAPAL